MTLSANQIKLLNDFAKTQIALNEVGVPYPQSGIQLGDVLSALESTVGASVADTAYGVAWNTGTTVAPSQHATYVKLQALAATIPALSVKTTTTALGVITIAGMTATGAVQVTALADPGVGFVYSHVVCGAGKITCYIKDTATGTATVAISLPVAYQIVQLS